jgi:hypothetical protein
MEIGVSNKTYAVRTCPVNKRPVDMLYTCVLEQTSSYQTMLSPAAQHVSSEQTSLYACVL